ncbi:hypothetical protein HQQ81_03875 [Microbacteriaceae bacterium VKM Ac-2854]|nr:hypothetical protein [Microbacteriaceae bacterium VKM Ac-2854]
MSALTVQADAPARAAGDVAAVIASLPVSLAPADENTAGAAELVAIAGSAGWSGRAAEALAAGAHGVLVIEPVAEDVAALDGLVVLDRTFASNPGLSAALPAIEAIDDGALLEARVVVPVGADLDAALLGQLALVRAAGSPVAMARILARSAAGYTVRGELESGRSVLLTAVASDARPAAASLRLLGATSAVEVEIPAPVAARPLRATVTTAEGATLLPTQYETAHRASWRRLRDLLASGSPAADLDAFAADAALAASL